MNPAQALFPLPIDVNLEGGAALRTPTAAGLAGKGRDEWGSEKNAHFQLQSFCGGGRCGFNAPVGNDTPYITWGGNFTGGGGLGLPQRFTLLGEFEFLDNKLPGAFIAAGGGQGGNSHIISLTVDPVIDLLPTRVNSIYVTGGGRYCYKSTNFTVSECCEFYGYPVNVTTNSFSSNQFGANWA